MNFQTFSPLTSDYSLLICHLSFQRLGNRLNHNFMFFSELILNYYVLVSTRTIEVTKIKWKVCHFIGCTIDVIYYPTSGDIERKIDTYYFASNYFSKLIIYFINLWFQIRHYPAHFILGLVTSKALLCKQLTR